MAGRIEKNLFFCSSV